MVIGIDGAEWSLINNWISQGKLPTFKKLIENGASGLLKSTLPPITPPAWVSAFTGVNPGKHNIFGFFVHEGYNIRVVDSTDVKAKTIWEILGAKGLKVTVVNVPVTYPPEKVNGIMVSGMVGFRDVSLEYTYPREIRNELEKIGYITDVPVEARLGHALDPEHLLHMTEKRKEAVIHLLKNYPWDLFIVVFAAPDRVQHFYWRYLIDGGANSPFKNVILSVYEALDAVLEELVELVGKDTNIIIFSDHGFGPLKKEFFLNHWFKGVGLLKPLMQRDYGVLKGLISRATSFLPDRFRPLIVKRKQKSRSVREGPQAPGNIDWLQTRAWLGSSDGRVTINLKGRQPSGIVEPNRECDEVRNSIIQGLLQLQDADTGEKIIANVYKREEIYHGLYAGNGPDLLVEPKAGYFLQNQVHGEELCRKPGTLSADHRPDGIFLAYGPDFKTGHKTVRAQITDITPTILHLMQASVPDYMDGRVLTETFASGSEQAIRAVRYERIEGDVQRTAQKDAYTRKEEEDMKERLRRLGYM